MNIILIAVGLFVAFLHLVFDYVRSWQTVGRFIPAIFHGVMGIKCLEPTIGMLGSFFRGKFE